jgi:hypothetical protein
MRRPTRHVARVNKFFVAALPSRFPFLPPQALSQFGASLHKTRPQAHTQQQEQEQQQQQQEQQQEEEAVQQLERLLRGCALASAAEEAGAGESGSWARILRVADPAALPLCFVGDDGGGEGQWQSFVPPAEARSRWMALGEKEGGGGAAAVGQQGDGGGASDEESGSSCSSSSSSSSGDGGDGSSFFSSNSSSSSTSSLLPPPLPLLLHRQEQHVPLPHYIMDLASIVAALALDVREGHAVADFCAAPGA